MYLDVNQRLIPVRHTTERLVISQIEDADASFILKLANTPGWIQNIGDRNIRNEADALKMVAVRYAGSYALNGFGMYMLRSRNNNVLIGICGFIKRVNLKYPDIGFAILPDFMRKGYCFEAASSLIALFRNWSDVPKVMGITSKDNIGSQKLLEKLGFHLSKKYCFSDSGAENLLYELRL